MRLLPGSCGTIGLGGPDTALWSGAAQPMSGYGMSTWPTGRSAGSWAEPGKQAGSYPTTVPSPVAKPRPTPAVPLCRLDERSSRSGKEQVRYGELVGEIQQQSMHGLVAPLRDSDKIVE